MVSSQVKITDTTQLPFFPCIMQEVGSVIWNNHGNLLGSYYDNIWVGQARYSTLLLEWYVDGGIISHS